MEAVWWMFVADVSMIKRAVLEQRAAMLKEIENAKR